MRRCHGTDDALLIEIEVEYPDRLESKEDSEYGFRARGWAWAEDVDTRSLVSSPCASTFTPGTLAIGLQSTGSRPSSLTPHPLNVQESRIITLPRRPNLS